MSDEFKVGPDRDKDGNPIIPPEMTPEELANKLKEDKAAKNEFVKDLADRNEV
jgi:hypothetical protein